jgi:hypothetical protein
MGPIIEQYAPQDIFNMHKTALCYYVAMRMVVKNFGLWLWASLKSNVA